MSATPNDVDIIRHSTRYRSDNIGLLNLLLLGLIILIAALVLFIFVQITTRPKPLHFRLNENLQIIDPVPLDQEGISKAQLLNWISNVVLDAFSFNYSNQNRQAALLVQYFNDSAMQQYLNYLQTDQDFASIATNKFVVSVQIKSAPEIITSKDYKGRYAWQIRVPMQIRFNNALSRGWQDVEIDFLVLRVPETVQPLGVQVITFTTNIKGRVPPQILRRTVF